MKALLVLLVLFFTASLFTNLYAQPDNNSDEPHGKVWGLAFGDYFYKSAGDSTGTQLEYTRFKKNANAFAFRRIFLGYDYTISKNFDTRVVLAFDGFDTLSDGNRAVYIKDAYLTWNNIFANANATIGIMPTPGYSPFSEKVWGYRSIEKTIMDQRGILSSRDMGIMLNGTFDAAKNYGYYLMAGNGSGTRLEYNKDKKFYAAIFGNFLNKKLTVNFYSDYERSTGNDRFTYQGFAGYVTEKFSVGAEAFKQNNITSANPFGISGFFNTVLMKDKLKFFGRYDFYNSNKKSTTGFNQHFVTAGLEFTPVKNVHIMPNIWLNAYSAKENETTKRISDVVPRLTFYFEYR